LKYWQKISSVTAPFNATKTVKIDGNNEPSVAQSEYSPVSIAIPPSYANGVHTIRFEYINPAGSGVLSFFG
jgi:hypothetical protein